MNCRELITFLETEVPLETAEGWDNPGFLVGDKDKEIKKVLVVLDITNEAVDYAIDQKADFILAHHPISVGEYAKKVKEAFSLENVMVFGNLDTKISKLAVVPGSGRSMISEAKSTGADAFLTGDIGHHEGLDAVDMGMCVIDAGHYGLEQVFIDDMKDLIRTHFSDMNVITYKAGSPYKVV